MMPNAPASNTRDTSARSGAVTVTMGVTPLSRTSVRNIANPLPSFSACSASTINTSNPALSGDFNDRWRQRFEDVDAEYRLASFELVFRGIGYERLLSIHWFLIQSR